VIGRYVSVRLLLASAILVGLCACSSGGEADRASQTEAILRATLVTSGALTASTTYTTTTGPHTVSNCRAAADTGNSSLREFTVRGPGSRSAPLYFEFLTVGYHGSATYEQRALKLDSVLAIIDRNSVNFERAPESGVSMTIGRDGSGSATFASFVSRDGRRLNGVVKWRCHTQPATA
jgi:hypothetical protein